MSKLIIYFSLSGHNREFANDLAEEEEMDIIEFAPGGYLRIFQFLCRGRLARRAKKIDTRNYDEIILFGPIWGGKPAPAVMALLKNLDLEGKSIDCHISHTGNKGETESIIKEILSERNVNIKSINFSLIPEKET